MTLATHGMRRCTRCNGVFPKTAENFPRNDQYPPSWCKACQHGTYKPRVKLDRSEHVIRGDIYVVVVEDEETGNRRALTTRDYDEFTGQPRLRPGEVFVGIGSDLLRFEE